MIALFLYSTGAQRQTISVLSTLGLSESYSNLISNNILKKRQTKVLSEPPNTVHISETQADLNPASNLPLFEAQHRSGTLHQLSDSMRQKAREGASSGLYQIVYDNINLQKRSAEQIIGSHGT